MKADLIMLNVSYKTMAKAMAARIKFSLTRIVCREQLGLLQGLSIHEAILAIKAMPCTRLTLNYLLI